MPNDQAITHHLILVIRLTGTCSDRRSRGATAPVHHVTVTVDFWPVLDSAGRRCYSSARRVAGL